MARLTDDWQQIIWREWRHCADPDYAEQLYELIADAPLSWGARLSAISFNIAGGGAIAIVCGAILTFDWAVLQHFAWAGALLGGLHGYLMGRRLSWRSWLSRLSANTPTSSLSRVIFLTLMLGLLGGLIFGPIFWLLALGLFWGAGALIHWINQGLTATAHGNLEDRRWWFWWRGRPLLFEVETALQQGCALSPIVRRHWALPLRQLSERGDLPVLPDTLIADLLDHDWVERFVARHRLVRLGQAAIPALRRVAQQDDDSPLRQTARWLLYNIEHPSKLMPPDARRPNKISASRED